MMLVVGVDVAEFHCLLRVPALAAAWPPPGRLLCKNVLSDVLVISNRN